MVCHLKSHGVSMCVRVCGLRFVCCMPCLNHWFSCFDLLRKVVMSTPGLLALLLIPLSGRQVSH